MRKILRIFCICSFLVGSCVHDCKATCASRNLARAQVVNRPCRKPCLPGSGRCKGGKICKCDHECGYSCINPSKACDRPLSLPHVQVVHIKRNISGSTIVVFNPPYLHDDFVEYECQPGYTLNQFKPIMCHGRKNWTEGNVFCTPTCEPKTLNNIGQFRFACGNPCVTDRDCNIEELCLCDGSCGRSCVNPAVDCGVAPASTSATINYTGQGFYREAHYSCAEGFYLVSGSPTRKCTGSGIYDGNLPQCSRFECSDPFVAFEATGGEVTSHHRPRTYSVDAQVEFRCPSTHRLLGPTFRTCLIDGRWSGLDSACDQKDTSTRCPHPGVPINGRLVRSSNFSVGSVIQFSCDPGYLMVGEQEQECMYFLQWSDEGAPQCIDPDMSTSNYQAVDQLRSSLEIRLGSPIAKSAGGRIISTNLNDKVEIYFAIDLSVTDSGDCLDQSINFLKNLLNQNSTTEKYQWPLHKINHCELEKIFVAKHIRYKVGVVLYSGLIDVVLPIRVEPSGSSKQDILNLLQNVNLNREILRRKVGRVPNLNNVLRHLVEWTNASQEINKQIYFMTCGLPKPDNPDIGTLLTESNLDQFKDHFNARATEVFAILICLGCKNLWQNTRNVLLSIASSYEHVLVIKDSILFQNLDLHHGVGVARRAHAVAGDDNSCGKAGDTRKVKKSVGRVTNGNRARRGAWPWHVVVIRAVNYLSSLYDEQYRLGGGSLINHKWILTAAHLFEGVRRLEGWHRSYRVILGTHKLSMTKQEFLSDAKIFEPEKIVLHEGFKINISNDVLQDFDYDVALIKLGREYDLPYDDRFYPSARTGWVNYTSLIRPVCLPCMENSCAKHWLKSQENRNSKTTEKQTAEGSCENEGNMFTTQKNTKTVIIGYGYTGHYGQFPTNLQQGRVDIKPSDKCSSSIPHMHVAQRQAFVQEDQHYNFTYTDRMLCALGENDNSVTDACQGDSGGALIREIYNVTTKTGCWIQIGIVSWGFNCESFYFVNGTRRYYPGYYTNVFSVSNWIKLHIELQPTCVANYAMKEPGRKCRKPCQTDEDCKGILKRCLCDDVCGMSCFNPNATCEPLPVFTNGKISGNYSHGKAVNYVCNEGFKLEGNSMRKCRSDKKWTGSQPICKRQCTDPVLSTRVSITKRRNAYFENDIIVFSCNGPDLVLRGENASKCQINGEWSAQVPRCLGSCPTRNIPADITFQPQLAAYASGDKMTFKCNQQGFNIFGSSTSTCGNDGQWTSVVPECRVDKDCNFEDFNRPFCGFTNERNLWKRTFSSDVPVGARGFIVASNFDAHHDLHERAILSSSLVSRESFICFKFYYKLKKIRLAGNFQIKIENGRQLWRPTTVAIKDEWLSTDIKFRATPGVPSFVVQFIAIKGSSTSPTEIEIDEIEFTANDSCENECQKKPCRNGGKCLNLIGGYRCVCTPRYIGKNCETALTCRVPQPPLHGSVSPTSGTDVFIKESIRFNCGLDYKLFGSSSSTCIRRRTWSSVVPYCRRKCPYQHASERVFVKGRKQVNTEGDQVNYSCKARSMTLIGSSTSKCQSSGEWSNKSPICKRKCSLPIPPTGVSIKKTRNDYFDNDVIIFSCNRPDLVLRGEKSSRCLTNGQWSAPIPRCLRLCSARDVPAGITIQSQSAAYAAGDQVTFTCQQGFNLIGSSTSTCRNDGQWSSVVPECRVPARGNVTLTKKQPDCPAGYIKQSPLCYKVIHILFNHADATAECEADGATLPVIRNSEMESLLNKIARKHTIKSYWLGLSKPKNLWQWANGIQYNRNDHKNFRSGEYARYGCFYVSVYGGWRWRECWRTRQTLCIKWEEAVKPLKVKAIPNTSNVQEYNGIYQPVYGVVHGGAAFYDQQISVIARYSIYYINDGDRWYIGKTRPTSNNHRDHIYANSFVTYPQKVNEQLWNSDFVSFREMSIKAFEVWSEWSFWSECPSSCGYFYRNRNRSCLMDSDSVLCFAKSSERVSCRNPCPLAIGNSSYKVYSGERVNFMKAREICKQNNGNLATIKKHETQANLLKEIKKLSEQSYFIGLTRHNSDKWCWVDGQQVNVGGSNMEGYSHWRSREPNNWEGVEACGSLYPNDQGKWSDINCNRSQSFICENQLNLCISTPCANGAKCEGTSSFYKCLCNTNTSGKRCENNFHCQLPETQNILETDIGYRSGINVGESIIYKGSGAVKRKYKYVCNDDGLSDAVLLQCPFLSDPENGKIVWDAIGQNQPGSTVSFVCDEGYVLQGVSNLFCTAGFQWTSNMPLCAEAPIQQQPCPNLTYPQNGKIEFSSNGNQYHVGSQASFSCKEGYRLNGASKLICQNDSKWNFRKPVCEEALPSQPTPLPQQQHCPNLAAPTNGSLTFSVKVPKNQAGSEALFSCRQGFKLKGSKKLVCLFGREWSAQPPVCEARGCHIFRLPEGISINFIPGKEYRPGENVTFSCENSSEQIFDAVCVKNEQWNPPLTAERCS